METTKRKASALGKKLGNVNAIVIALVALVIITAIGSDKFLTWTNISNILRQSVPLGVMGCAGVFVIISGHIDLSVGSILSLTALICCNMVEVGIPVAILLPLLVGTICGISNGLLVGVLRFNPFITTLGTLSVFQAIAFYYCNNKFLSAAPNEAFAQMGQGFLLEIPIPVYILAVVFVIFTFILRKTTFGRDVYAVGGNPDCAKFSGISYSKTVTLVYMLSGMLAALAAVIMVARNMSAQPEMGSGYEFDLITALVVGGVALSGGKGTLWGGFLGVLFITMLKNSFVLLDIPLFYQYSVNGVILLLAVWLDVLSERRIYYGEKE